jgi:hypothetical protein
MQFGSWGKQRGVNLARIREDIPNLKQRGKMARYDEFLDGQVWEIFLLDFPHLKSFASIHRCPRPTLHRPRNGCRMTTMKQKGDIMPLTFGRRMIITALLAITMFLAWGLSNTSHEDAADATWHKCAHQTQGIHELSNPPSSWPGTRAAHTVTRFQYSNSQYFYTKSGWWDPTWDFYFSEAYANC